MGITGLSKYLNDNGLLKSYDIDELDGKIIAVDMGVLMCRYYNIAAKTIVKSMDLRTERFSEDMILPGFISSVVMFLSSMLGYGVIPILVFDGKKSQIKSDEHEKRDEQSRKKRKNMLKLIKQMDKKELIDITSDDIENLVKAICNASLPNKNSKNVIIEICKKSGIPVLLAEYEADIVCATLVRKSLADAVYSKDTDMLAHLTESVIVNISNNMFTAYLLPEILSKMKVSKNQFRDICIFSGCDYNGVGMRGYGIIKLLKILKEYGSFKSAAKSLDSFDLKSCKYEQSRKEFSKKKLNKIVDGDYKDFQLPQSIEISDDFKEIMISYGCKSSLKRYTNILNDMQEHIQSILAR